MVRFQELSVKNVRRVIVHDVNYASVRRKLSASQRGRISQTACSLLRRDVGLVTNTVSIAQYAFSRRQCGISTFVAAKNQCVTRWSLLLTTHHQHYRYKHLHRK